MSKAKAKGRAAEHAAVKYFVKNGYAAERVPMSGAIGTTFKGVSLKGDVIVSNPGTWGKDLQVEVKSRRDEYSSLYSLLDSNNGYISWNIGGQCVKASYSFDDLNYARATASFFDKGRPTRATGKLLTMQRLVKGCDFLMVKNDRKPFIFIRYITPGESNV